MIKKLGVQLYTIRESMKTADDVRASFKKLRELGYTQAQTAGCAIPYDEFGKLAREAGIEIVGTHDNLQMLFDDPEQSMANHRLLGTTNIGTGGMPGQYFESKENLAEFIKKANAAADIIYKQGFKFTYHNHSREYMKFDGKTIMEILADGLDPVKTSFVLDTYWVQHGGGDVRYWIEKLAGRIDILHLKDMGRNAQGPFITEIGNGNLYFKAIVETAESTGVKYYVVEQDSCPADPFDSLKSSAEYIKANLM